jgi:enamine deaminase RidA (YjgF/YER057c/UK114 family)
LSFGNVADSTVYLTDLSQFAAMNAVYRESFPTAPPARATIGTKLVSRNAIVEILMTAVR